MEKDKITTYVQIIFYSMYGHTYQLARAIEEGANQVPDVEVSLSRVPELIPEEVLIKSGAREAQKAFIDVPIAQVSQLTTADAILLGTPTRFGNMCAQMRNFLDQTGGIWARGQLIGKVGSVFTSSTSQHGGQETTLITTQITLLHHGMIVVGVPYSETGLANTQEMSGGGPYGASTIAGSDGKRQPSVNELNIAKFQGKNVAEIARSLKLS